MPGNLYRVDVVCLLDSKATALLSQWDESLQLGAAPAVSDEALVEAFHQRQVLDKMVRQIKEDLKEDADLALLTFLSPLQKIRLKQRLVRAHYLTSLQVRIDEIEFRLDRMGINKSNCTYYESLIRALDAPSYERNPDPGEQLERLSDESDKPLAWFGARVLAPILAVSMVDLCAGNTSAIRNLLIEIDRKDIYLGWSRNFIMSFFNLLPQVFSGNAENYEHLRDAGVYFSYINILVVNTCLAIELLLVLKNTFSGVFATRHQHFRVDVWDQFTTQIRQRRFVLLNWMFLSLMHVAAFLCFSAVLNTWPWGPVFAVGCRLVQLVLMSARYRDEETAYLTNVKRYCDQINDLNEKEQRLLYDIAHTQDKEEKAMLLQIKLIMADRESLRHALKKIKVDWEIKNNEFNQQSILSTCVFTGVMMFSCLVFPATIIAPPIGLGIAFAGAVICIVAIIGMSVMRSNSMSERIRQDVLGYHQSDGRKTLMDEQFDAYMAHFKALQALPDSPENAAEMKQYYLRMMQLVSRSDVQLQMLERQRVDLWITLARDVLVPILALAMFVFIPTPVGIGAVLGLVVLCFVAKKMYEAYKPIISQPLKFNEETYNQFANNPTFENLSVSRNYIKNKYQSLLKDRKIESADDAELDFNLGPDIP